MSERAPIVVTGADGFAGRALCAYLRGRGMQVRELVRGLDGKAHAREDDNVATGDLAASDEHALATAIRGAHAVVHLAGRAHIAREMAPAAEHAYQLANCVGSQRLARAAVACGIAQFIFASTVKVNGEATLPEHPFVESDAANPRDAYARSKWAAEQALREIARDTDLEVTVLRLPLMYGPGVKGNFAKLVNAVVRGVPLPLGAVANRRSLLSVHNFASAIEALLASHTPATQHRPATYFVADAEAPSTPALIRAVANALGVSARLVSVPLPLLRLAGACINQSAAIARLTNSLEVDTAAFRGATGWRPPFTLEEGLRGVTSNAG
ncbi:MAG: NAD-dependent epimerase/dehydratase family protein [Casimicrobiaceae bacterium]